MHQKYVRRKVTSEINGTSNLGNIWERDVVKLGVVGDLESTGNRAQLGERDVVEQSVSNQCERSSVCFGCAAEGSQVGRGKALDIVAVESKRSVDSLQGWDADAGTVAEGHVGSSLQVGELNFQTLSVGLNVKQSSDVGNLGAEAGETAVVVDVQCFDGVQVNTFQAAQECVGDEDVLGLLDERGEGQLLQDWKSGPFDGADFSQLGEGQG